MKGVEWLEHAGRAVNQDTDAVGAPGRQVASFEHALVEAGSEQERGVRRQVAGVVARAKAAALIGEEEGVELTRYPALSDVPSSGGLIDQFPPRRSEVPKPIGERRHDQLAALSGG